MEQIAAMDIFPLRPLFWCSALALQSGEVNRGGTMNDDFDKRDRFAFGQVPAELRILLKDIECEPIPEKLLDLARELQMKLAGRRRRLDS